jgi:hypothetical protein
MMTHTLATRSNSLLAPSLDYFLIDGSGSMKVQWWETLSAIDNFTGVLRKANCNSHGIVSVFSGRDLQMIQRDSLILDWKPFRDEPLASTWLGTPLYDAIQCMGLHLRELAPSSCSIVIVTDGGDTNSKTSAEQARSILDWCRAHGWTVTFLGANFDNSRVAKLLGADTNNSLGIRKELLAESGKLLGKKRVDGNLEFSDDEKLKFGGYLGHG